MTSPAFTTRGLTKVYGEGHTAVHALRGVDLEIPKGEVVVLLGPSGSVNSDNEVSFWEIRALASRRC